MLTIKEKIKNKKILFVPVYSTRSYKTGDYNLALDGNMARIISKILYSKPEYSTVLIPKKYVNLKVWEDILLKNNFKEKVNFIECDAYGTNANETRKNDIGFINWLTNHIVSSEYDCLIAEPNMLVVNMKEMANAWVNNFNDIIYWCVASATSKGIPWFTKEFDYIDKEISKQYLTACASFSQVEYLGGMSFLDDIFYNPEYFDFKTIFFPFRLSDKNYQAGYVRETIQRLRKNGYNNFKVLYTDVNDSDIFLEDEVFVKVPGQKEVYLSILKSKPIIPYMENADMLMHININEFIFYDCKVIMKKNETIKYDSFHYIKNDDELYEALIQELESEG